MRSSNCEMLPTSPVLQISLITTIASAIVIPSQLYDMVNHIVDSYAKNSCLVVMSNGGYMPANHVPAVYLPPYYEENEDQNLSSISEDSYKTDILAPVLELGCTGYLIQAENPAKQLQLIEQSFIYVNQRNQRKFIFLPTITTSAREPIGVQDEVLDSENFNFRLVLLEKSVQYIPDIIFAVPNDEKNLVAIFTHRFTGPDEVCHQAILLDTYNVVEERFELGVNLFPDKVEDLEGKVLKIALFHYPPFVVIESNNETIQIDGTEWRFAQNFIERHNCTFELLIHDPLHWGCLYKNFTGNGILGTLLGHKSDIAMASLFFSHQRYTVFDFSFPHHRTQVKCLVPGSLELPQWMSPIRPFASYLWATFAGMTVVSGLFILFVNRAESFILSENSFRMGVGEAALTVARIMLLQGVKKESKGPAWAALSVTLLVVALLIATAYGSSLASAITVPGYERPINTAVELAASGMPWVGTTRLWLLLILQSEEPEMQTLVKNFQELSAAELTQHAQSAADDHWAFAIEQIGGDENKWFLFSINEVSMSLIGCFLVVANYVLPPYLTIESAQKMHVMKKDIYQVYSTPMLRKSSPFTRRYTQRILELHASGIPIYWQTVVALQHLDTFMQKAVKTDNPANGGPVRIRVRHLQGAFFVLLIGLVLSSLVFLGELFVRPRAWEVTGQGTIEE